MVSHTATGEWKSFEFRMRCRRAERLLLRANTAADAGCFEEARVAIDEARALWPGAPGLAETEQRLAERSVEHPQRSAHWKEYGAGAAVVAFAGSAAFAAAVLITNRPADVAPSDGNTHLESSDVGVPPLIHIEPPQASRIPVQPSATTSEPQAFQPPMSPPIETQIEAPPIEKPQPDAPRAEAPRVETPRLETSRPNAPAEATPTPEIRISAGRADLMPVAPLEIPTAPAPAAAKPPAAAVTRSAYAPLPQPQQDALVSAVLTRFASAYSNLDVDAAARVWPTVNRSALARAFESLSSQHVSLGDCQISVNGGAAQARCVGVATWTPKVGGGERTDSRSWNFELAKEGAGWLIVSARVQNK